MSKETQSVTRKPKERPSLQARAFWRYLTISAVMAVLVVIYTRHPYYQRGMYEPWRRVFTTAFYGWLVAGLPYCYLTVKRFYSTSIRSYFVDGGILWMVIGRAAWSGKWRRVWRRRTKNAILGLCVKAFYAPLMTSFVTGHFNNIARAWALRKGVVVFNGANIQDWWHYVTTTGPRLIPNVDDLSSLFHPAWYTLQNVQFADDVYYNVLFFVDCMWAWFGYCMESQWFKNKTKSVEPTMLGWAAALFCYPPFNDVLGTYMPLDGSHQFIHNAWGREACRLLMLAAFTIYAAATVSFGMKFSNLTNRGIITRGPYAWMRHPAYVCKGFAWWMENLPNLSVQSAIFLVGLNAWYGLRAWTEERHLSKDPAYLEYKKKVRWALIPGVW